ncbi:MAG: AAA family ATPase [Pseudomonadota bacterium]
MYLEHFGIAEHPFRITPVTEFFFSGANRGEILDALIYSICEVEGIVKVSGEVGSGKTMLCRMLLEKLPGHIETIYLANPSLSREEMLYAIADGLGLSTSGERVGVIMSMIQNKLEAKAREGKRIVVLVDEAHAMPLDTLEELRLLYNLQVGNSKLMQIVLFGQPELNTKLDQPNMRQLKDRIVHHFNMQPLSRNILESYLMFRMRAAGYHGPNIFSPGAVKLIADASNGLMRRVNILADKSLLSAFVEDTYYVKTHHVQAALRDSDLEPTRSWTRRGLLLAITATALLMAGLTTWWMLESTAGATSRSAPQETRPSGAMGSVAPPAKEPGASAVVSAQTMAPKPDNMPAPAATVAENQLTTPLAETAPPVLSREHDTTASGAEKQEPPPASRPEVNYLLFEQRMAAGKQLLAQKSAVASIQLFYNENINPERIEGFLGRADKLGILHEIYLLPTKFGKNDGLRVLYGAYPSIDAARKATKELPKRYREAFATSIHIF